MRFRFFLCLALFIAVRCGSRSRADGPPRIVGHRGLMRHAPENTLSGFAACIHLRLGFELDIRRSKDGMLVIMHDDDLSCAAATSVGIPSSLSKTAKPMWRWARPRPLGCKHVGPPQQVMVE